MIYIGITQNAYGVYHWEPIKIILKKLDIFINRKTGKVENNDFT